MHVVYKRLRFLSIAISMIIAVSFTPANAQMAVARITIGHINFENFPEVKVRAIIRDGKGEPVLIQDLSGLQLSEKAQTTQEVVSDQLHEYGQAEVKSGVQTLFVLDIQGDLAELEGRSYKSNSTEREKMLVEMQSVVQSLVDMMPADDQTGIIVVQGQTVTHLQPLTSDKEKLREAIFDIPQKGSQISYGLGGVKEALAEFGKSTSTDPIIQTVILITPRLYEPKPEDLQQITEQVAKQKVFISAILLHRDSYQPYTNDLLSLTGPSLGKYAHYSGLESLQEMQSWWSAQHKQIELTFRSKIVSTAGTDRILELKVGTISDVSTYNIDTLEPPAIIFTAPVANEEIRREAKVGQTAEDAQPTSKTVTASVVWPDGYSKRLSSAQFYVDGEPTGPPVYNPSEQLSFEWDLHPYRKSGTTTAKLKIQVIDELGQIGEQELSIQVTVIVPETIGTAIVNIIEEREITPTPICYGTEGMDAFGCQAKNTVHQMSSTPSGIISIISMVVALFAIVLAVRFRGQLAQAGGQVVDFVRETVTRLTRPANVEAGAFLEVLRGDEELQGKTIPLYIRTVTPAGRSPQEVELVFQLGVDRSVVSRRHCEFREDDGVFKVRDLGSAHGTFVNAIRLPEGGDGHELRNGDKIEIGPVERGGVLLQFRTTEFEGTESPNNDSEDEYKTKPAYHE